MFRLLRTGMWLGMGQRITPHSNQGVIPRISLDCGLKACVALDSHSITPSKPALAITGASAFIPAVILLLNSRLTLLSGSRTGRSR